MITTSRFSNPVLEKAIVEVDKVMRDLEFKAGIDYLNALMGILNKINGNEEFKPIKIPKECWYDKI